jgi:hypothetical protein
MHVNYFDFCFPVKINEKWEQYDSCIITFGINRIIRILSKLERILFLFSLRVVNQLKFCILLFPAYDVHHLTSKSILPNCSPAVGIVKTLSNIMNMKMNVEYTLPSIYTKRIVVSYETVLCVDAASIKSNSY